MLSSNQPLTTLAKNLNLNTWKDVLNHVRQLPYGRNLSREDFSLVLKEQQGSCSSKHALLKTIALENNLDQVQLVLAIFKMNAKNTPKLASILEQHNIPFIPEAHCFLKIDEAFIDVTNQKSNYNSFKNNIIETQFILPHQVINYKVNYHKNWIASWLKETKSNYKFEEFWAIRDACISKLSE